VREHGQRRRPFHPLPGRHTPIRRFHHGPDFRRRVARSNAHVSEGITRQICRCCARTRDSATYTSPTAARRPPGRGGRGARRARPRGE
jgi:hypothetical protein